MQNANSFYDIQMRYDPGYNPNAVKNVLDWNPSEMFRQYLAAVRERRDREEGQQIEDALMAVIDSMNASEDESGADRDQAVTEALRSAGEAVSQRANGKGDPTQSLPVQVILACLGDRARLEMADAVREEHEEQLEQLERTDKTLKGGENDECNRPVYDAADAADGRRNGEPAQKP